MDAIASTPIGTNCVCACVNWEIQDAICLHLHMHTHSWHRREWMLCCGLPYDRKLNFMSTCVAYNQREFVRIGGTCICYNHYFGPQKRIVGKRVYVGETGEIM